MVRDRENWPAERQNQCVPWYTFLGHIMVKLVTKIWGTPLYPLSVLPKGLTDPQSCPAKCTRVHLFWSYLEEASDRPPPKKHESVPGYACFGQGHFPPPVTLII